MSFKDNNHVSDDMNKIVFLSFALFPVFGFAKMEYVQLKEDAPYCNTLKDLSKLADAYKDFALMDVATLTSSGKCSTLKAGAEIQVVNKSKYGFIEFNTDTINNAFIASQYVDD